MLFCWPRQLCCVILVLLIRPPLLDYHLPIPRGLARLEKNNNNDKMTGSSRVLLNDWAIFVYLSIRIELKSLRVSSKTRDCDSPEEVD